MRLTVPGEFDSATLAAWVDGGTAEGDPRDAPPPRQFPSGWQLGKPDLVLTVPEEFQVGPSGRDIFRCFVLPTNLTEDKYVAHEQAVWLIDRLKAADVEAELLTLEGAGHGFGGETARRADAAMVAFFDSHLKRK